MLFSVRSSLRDLRSDDDLELADTEAEGRENILLPALLD